MKQNPLSFIVVLLTFVALQASSQQGNTIQKQKFHWGREQDTTYGYTQAIKVENVLYISGTTTSKLTPEGITNVYEALKKTLQHYGATFQNVVKENLYTTDIEEMKKHSAARKVFYKGDYPAATWVQISRLFTDETKLEIELVAYLPK